jgi:hypothetical protein
MFTQCSGNTTELAFKLQLYKQRTGVNVHPVKWKHLPNFLKHLPNVVPGWLEKA